jgi:dihydrofolate reductase
MVNYQYWLYLHSIPVRRLDIKFKMLDINSDFFILPVRSKDNLNNVGVNMRKLIVLSFITLDGIMQMEEDSSDGFKYSGWGPPVHYSDEFSRKEMNEQLGGSYDLLIGRKTYDIFSVYWPQHKEGVIGSGFDRATKYVVSHKDIKLTWEKSVLLTDVEAIKKLKSQDGTDLQVHGSGNLVQTLMKHDLVDEFWLKIFPLTLGTGKRFFAEGTIPAAFKLTKSLVTPLGVIFAYFERAGEVKTGSLSKHG